MHSNFVAGFFKPCVMQATTIGFAGTVSPTREQNVLQIKRITSCVERATLSGAFYRMCEYQQTLSHQQPSVFCGGVWQQPIETYSGLELKEWMSVVLK